MHVRLAAELAFGAHFAGHARHLSGECVELIDHGVDGIFQLQNLAASVHGDLRRKVASGHRSGHLSDVAYLRCQVPAHGVHTVGEILQYTADALHLGLAAELAFGAHFARHARHFSGERVELVHHGVDGVLQLQDFAAHIDGDLARKVAGSHSSGDLSDVTDLRGQVAGHRVHRIGQILPHAAHTFNLCLTAQLAVGAHFTGHARDFRSERVELVHHGVDGVLQLQDFAAHVHRDLG